MLTFPTSLFHTALTEGCRELRLYAYNTLKYRILGGGYCGALTQKFSSITEPSRGAYGASLEGFFVSAHYVNSINPQLLR